MTYAIREKVTGLLFSGFGDDGLPIWSDKPEMAWVADKLTATAQAALFLCLGIPAQRKVIVT